MNQQVGKASGPVLAGTQQGCVGQHRFARLATGALTLALVILLSASPYLISGCPAQERWSSWGCLGTSHHCMPSPHAWLEFPQWRSRLRGSDFLYDVLQKEAAEAMRLLIF